MMGDEIVDHFNDLMTKMENMIKEQMKWMEDQIADLETVLEGNKG